MIPMRFLMLAGAALALCGAATSAQSQSGKVFARYNKPLKSLTLDLGTGTITRGPKVSNRKGNTVTDFDNNDLGGFVGVDTGGGFCLWIDAAIKGTNAGRTAGPENNSDLMNSITYAYCSAKLTPGSGGPGGTMALHAYEGYTLFGGAATTSVAHFTLTGLPGNSASSSFFGGFGCFFISVRFEPLLCFADGQIGYGWTFLDNGYPTANPLSSVLAGTWPFLSCTVSCSADILQYDLQGMTDAVDEYCPTTSLRATFTFGTTSGSFTSMSMAIEEVVDQTASIMTCAGVPANPDVLTATTAVVGSNWTTTVKTGVARTKAGSWTLYVGDVPVGKPAGILIPQFPKCPNTPSGVTVGNYGILKGGRRLLCNIDCQNPTSCLAIPIGAAKGSSSSCVIALPKRISLVCYSFCAQADVFGAVAAADGGGNHRLTTGLFGVVGTNFP